MERSLEGTLPAHIPPLSVGKIDNVSKARIRLAFSQLAQGNIEHVERWIHEVALGIKDPTTQKYVRAPNPALAAQLYMSFAEFVIPKVKAVAVSVDERPGNARRLTTAELQSIVSEQ